MRKRYELVQTCENKLEIGHAACTNLQKGITPVGVLIAIAVSAIVVVGGGVFVNSLRAKGIINFDFSGLKNAIYDQADYLDASKVNGGTFDPVAVGTAILPDGSFSAFKVLDATVADSGTKYESETKIEFLSGDQGLGSYSDGVIAPFYLTDGTKTIGSILDRFIVNLVYNGVSYPLKISQGTVTSGKLTGEFVGQTFQTGYIIAGRVDTSGHVSSATVTNGASLATEAETSIAQNALSLFKKVSEVENPKVLAASTSVGTYQVVGSNKPVFDPKTGRWAFATTPTASGVVSTSPAQNVSNYLQNLNQAAGQGQNNGSGGLAPVTNTIYQYLPAYLQTPATVVAGVKDIKSGSSNVKVTTVDGVATVSVDVPTSTPAPATTTTVVVPDNSVTSSKIQDFSINPQDLSPQMTFAPYQLFDFSNISYNSAAPAGIRLPMTGTNPANPFNGKGYIAYDAINNNVIQFNGSAWVPVGGGVSLTTTGQSSNISSNSGLELTANQLSLLRGCSDGQVLKWNSASKLWQCSGSSSGINTVQENGTTIVPSAYTLNFTGNDFNVTNLPTGQANVGIDYTNSNITRSNQPQTITGAWSFPNGLTLGTDTITDINGSGLALVSGVLKVSGITNSNLSGAAGITNANLQNSGITFAGNTGTGSVALGGNLTIAGAGINNAVYSGGTVTITGTEVDTLATVTGRGATTSTDLTLGNVGFSGGKTLIVGSFATDPGNPANGAIWYNVASAKYKIRENGVTKILCNTTDAGCGANAVTSLDGLNGALTISNTTGTGSTITINDAKADGSTKGIAAFNASNFTDSLGVINTIQNIGTLASPTFAGLVLGADTVTDFTGSGLAVSSGALTVSGLTVSNFASPNISQFTNNANYLTGISWGGITGTLANQTDLQTALNAKANSSSLGTAAFTPSTDYATAAQGTLATNALPTASFTDSAVSGKLITGYTSGGGTVAATDTILQAIQKLNGNNATNANLTGVVTSIGNATSIAAGAITNAMLVNGAVANLSGTNTGDNAVNSNYASDYRSGNFVAGTNYLAPSGSAASLTNFPTLNQNTTGTAAGLSVVLASTSGGSGVNNAGTLTWGAGGTLGTAAFTAASAYATAAQGTLATNALPTASFTDSAVSGKLLTGYVSGAGTVAATDSILQAIQKLNGNDATNANLTGVVTSLGNATSIANGAITNAMLANGAVANLSGTNSGDNSANSNYVSDFRATNFVAGTNYLAPNGSAASLTGFPTFNQNTTGTAAGLSVLLASTSGGSGVNNAGTLTWGSGGTLGTAAYTAASNYATAAQGNLATNALPTASFTDVAVNGKLITGYVSGAGVIAGTDSILQAIQKLNGNDATNANLTGVVTSVGNATSIANGAITNAMLANGAVANLSGTNTGDNAVNSNYSSDYRSTNFVAGTNYLTPTGSAAGLTSFPTFNQSTTGTASNITGVLGASSFPAMTGDVTNTQGSLSTAIASGAVTLTKMANIATASFLGRNTAGTGSPEVLSATTAKSILAIANTDVSGLGTMSTQASNNVSITGGSLSGLTSVGATTFTGALTGNASTVTGFSPASGKTLSVSKTMTFTSADDTGSYTLPTGTATLLATNGSAAGLTSFPTLNQNTTGTAAGLSVTLASTSGGSGVNNAGTLTWGVGGTLGTAAFTAASAYATAAQGTLATNALPTASFTDVAVNGKLITGYVSGAGVIAGTDSILQAIQKLNGNDATNANLTGVVTSVGNATSIAAGAITNTMLANGAVANLSGTNSGDNSVNSNYASDFRAANFIAGTNYLAPNGSAASLTSFPTFNQSTTGTASNITGVLGASSFPALTGDVTTTQGSLSTSISSGAVTLSKMANLTSNGLIGNNTGASSVPLALTPTQVKTMLAIANTDVSGLGTISTQASNNVAITGGTAVGLTGLGIRSTGTGAFDLTIANSENLTAGRTLTITTGNAARTLTLTGDASIAGTNTGDNATNSQYASDYRSGNFVAGTNYLTPTGSAAGLTSFPTLNQNTNGTAAGLSAVLVSTSGGSGVNNAGILTWGSGGTLGTAAYTASSAYATAAQGTLATNALPTSSFTDTAVSGKLLTNYVSGAGTVAATDTILQAIQKLNGNDATNANLTGVVTSVGNATSIAAGAITNTMLANGAVANLSGTNSGDNAVNSNYSSDYRSGNFIAGTNYLTPSGSGASLTGITGDQVLPTQTGNNGKVLGTNGSTVGWVANSSSVAWGAITGTLSNQTDLQTALNAKANSSSLGTISTQNSNNVTITGGTLSGLTSVGATTFTGALTGNASTVTGFSPTSGKTLSISKTMTFTSADDTGVYTLPTGTATLLATNGSAASLTSFPTFNQNTTGTAAGLSTLLVSTSGGSGVNNSGTLTWGTGGTLGTAAYTPTTNYATSAQGTLASNALPTASFTDSAVSGKLITGYVSGAGTVAATDSILQAIQKLNGNDATNANLTGVVTSVGNATAIANGAITNVMLANGAVANLSGTNTGDNSTNSNYASDFRAGNFIAGTNYLAPNGSAASLTSFPTLNQNTSGTASNITGVLGASSFPAMTGDVTNTQGSLANTIAAGAVTLSKMANLTSNGLIGNNTGGSSVPLALTPTQVKTMLAIANTDVSGLGTMSTQASNNVSITGGTLSGLTSVGATTFTGALTGNASTVTGFSPTSGKTLSVSKTMTFTSADDTGSYTLPTGTATLLATNGSAASLTSFPTLNQNTSGTAAGLSALLVSTSGGSGVNNAGTLTWGSGGTLGTAAYTPTGNYATAAQGTLAANALPTTSFTDTAVSGKLITGYTSGAGTVAATDSILQAIQKLNGNDATNANLTGVVTSVGNATSIAVGAITNAMLANGAVANLSGTNSGDNSANSTYASDYRSGNFIAGTNYLAPNGSGASLTGITGDQVLPTQTGNSGKVLGTNGTTVGWVANSSSVAWGGITGTLSNQTDLQTALGLKLDSSSFTDSAVSGKLLTGYTSGAGTVAATDTILQAIQKLNGNDATNANLTGVVTSVGNATSIAAGAITNAMLANGAVANLSGTNTGDNSANSNYASDFRAGNFVAGTNYLAPNGSAASLTSFPTFNQNTTGTASNITGVLGASSFPAMTGDVTNTQGSLANAITSGAVTLAKMANLAANSIIGNNTGSSATPIALTTAQVSTLLGLGTMSTQASSGVAITGGTLTGITGLTMTLGSDATGDLYTRSSGGGLSRIPAVALGSCLISQGTGTAPIWGGCGSASNLRLDQITAATTGPITIGNGVNAITWNWALASTGSTGMTFGETTAAASGGVVLGINTLTTSTANALKIANVGSGDALVLNNSNASGTNTNGIVVTQTAAGTLTNAIKVNTSAGAVTNGLSITGAVTNGVSVASTVTGTQTAYNLTTPVLTNSGGTTWNVIGNNISSAGALTANTSGSSTTNWYGHNVVMPTISVNNSAVITADGYRVLIPASGAVVQTSGTATMNGLEIVAPTTSGPASGTLNAIKIGTITSPGAGTQTAFSVGTGWNTILSGTTAGTNLISFSNFSVTNAGAVTGVGVNSGTGLVQGTGGLTLTGTVSVNNNTNSAVTINGGSSTGTVTVGGTGIMSILIGTGGTGAKTITIGDGASTGATTIKSGTGNILLTPTGSGAIIKNNTALSVVLSNAALATNATAGFTYIPSSAGAPTGVPAAQTGVMAMEYDTSNNKLMIYNSTGTAAWKGAVHSDYSEWAPAAGAEIGDIVTVTSSPNTINDPEAPFMLAKTTSAYDGKVVGVVSKYAEEANDAYGYKKSADYHAIALTGRVPVKIAASSQAISQGDFLTSSADPGRAMKATSVGEVIGKAVESWTPGSNVDQIMAFVQPQYYSGLTDAQGNNVSINPANVTTQSTASAVITTDQITGLSDFVNQLIDQKIANLFGNALKFTSNVEFDADSIFMGNVSFNIVPVFNSDTAGFAIIKQGDTEVNINFDKEYIATPIVNASPLWDTDQATLDVMKQLGTYILPKQDYIIVNSTTRGFSIVLDKPAVTDLKFSWIALAVKDARTVLSASVAAPSATPSPTLVPTATPDTTPQATPSATPAATETPSPVPSVSPSPVPSSTPAAQTLTILSNELGYVRLRDTPSASGNELDQVPTGTVLTYTDVQNGWYQVTYNGQLGWVSGTYVTTN